MPNTEEEFQQFGEALAQKINVFHKHTEFPTFAEELIKSIAVNRKLSVNNKYQILRYQKSIFLIKINNLLQYQQLH